MKKNRTLIVALLLVASLALGIGYAGITSLLSVNGTAKTAPTDIDVKFTTGCTIQSAKTADNNADRIAQIMAASSVGATGTLDIDFYAYDLREVGDSVTAVFWIQNDSDYSVNLADARLVSDPDYFKITFSDYVADPENAEGFNAATQTLAAGAKVSFTVTAELDTQTTTAGEIVKSFTVVVEATGVA